MKPTIFLTYEADVFRAMDRDVPGVVRAKRPTDASVKDFGHAAISETRVFGLAQPFDALIA